MRGVAAMEPLLGLPDVLRDVPGEHAPVLALAHLPVGVDDHARRHQYLRAHRCHHAVRWLEPVQFWCKNVYIIIVIE